MNDPECFRRLQNWAFGGPQTLSEQQIEDRFQCDQNGDQEACERFQNSLKESWE